MKIKESTNASVLYHFTTIDGLYGMARSGRVRASGGQKELSNGKNFFSFTRHKTYREGYAAAEGMGELPVRLEFDMSKVNSIHGVKTEPFEFYSPGRANITYNYENGDGEIEADYYSSLGDYDPRVGDESAKEIYRGEYQAYKDDEYAGYDEPEHEYYNQAEERMTTDRKFISTNAINRVDIAYFDPFDGDYGDPYDDIDDEDEPINEIIDSHFQHDDNWSLYEIDEGIKRLARLKNSFIPFNKIFIYSNEADFIRQTNNCITVPQFIQMLKGRKKQVAESAVKISKKKLTRLISESIQKALLGKN